MDEAQETGQNEVIVGNFTFTIPMPNNASCNAMGYIYLGDKPHEIHARMDLFVAALTRQQEKAEIPLLRAQIELYDKQIESVAKGRDDLEVLKKSGKKTLNSSQHAQLNNSDTLIKQVQEEKDKGLARIAALEKKHGVNAH